MIGIIIIIINRSTVAGLLLQLVGHVLCTSGLQVAWKTFWKAFFDSFFWTSVGPSCVALPRPREDGEEDCREDAADICRNWVQNGPGGSKIAPKWLPEACGWPLGSWGLSWGLPWAAPGPSWSWGPPGILLGPPGALPGPLALLGRSWQPKTAFHETFENLHFP